MPDDWNPNVPDVKQDFNEAAKQQAKKEVPFASEQGISTKAELDKRIENTRILRENLERHNAPKLKPGGETGKSGADKKYKKDKIAFEENEASKKQIRLRLEQKKKQEMHREFNRVSEPSRD